MEATKVTLGDREFKIKPLTIHVLLQLAGIIDQPPDGFAQIVERGVRIIVAALAIGDAPMSEDEVRALPATFAEIDAAAAAVMACAGLKSSGEAVPAEDSEPASAG